MARVTPAVNGQMTRVPEIRTPPASRVSSRRGNELEDLFVLRERAQKILGDQLCDLGVAAVGYPMQFRHAATALGLGMDCRVGMEDSLRVKRTQPVRDNAEMVEVAVQLADLLGRPIATPDELRSRLTRWVS
jgi:uncharacterized protein (DUF849 family)